MVEVNYGSSVNKFPTFDISINSPIKVKESPKNPYKNFTYEEMNRSLKGECIPSGPET